MQRSGGVAILMDRLPVEYVVGDEKILVTMSRLSALEIFSSEACSFLEALSRRILSAKECRAYPDVVTFAFWCRHGSIQQMAMG